MVLRRRRHGVKRLKNEASIRVDNSKSVANRLPGGSTKYLTHIRHSSVNLACSSPSTSAASTSMDHELRLVAPGSITYVKIRVKICPNHRSLSDSFLYRGMYLEATSTRCIYVRDHVVGRRPHADMPGLSPEHRGLLQTRPDKRSRTRHMVFSGRAWANVK